MITTFIVVAWLIALGSWLFISQATSGVAGLCFACFMAIAARIAQADAHQKQQLMALGSRTVGAMTIEQKGAAAGLSGR
jgi:hypothetical protein